jgi:hypothetical protein
VSWRSKAGLAVVGRVAVLWLAAADGDGGGNVRHHQPDALRRLQPDVRQEHADTCTAM